MRPGPKIAKDDSVYEYFVEETSRDVVKNKPHCLYFLVRDHNWKTRAETGLDSGFWTAGLVDSELLVYRTITLQSTSHFKEKIKERVCFKFLWMISKKLEEEWSCHSTRTNLNRPRYYARSITLWKHRKLNCFVLLLHKNNRKLFPWASIELVSTACISRSPKLHSCYHIWYVVYWTFSRKD